LIALARDTSGPGQDCPFASTMVEMVCMVGSLQEVRGGRCGGGAAAEVSPQVSADSRCGRGSSPPRCRLRAF
jgi:hypothetical protein